MNSYYFCLNTYDVRAGAGKAYDCVNTDEVRTGAREACSLEANDTAEVIGRVLKESLGTNVAR